MLFRTRQFYAVQATENDIPAIRRIESMPENKSFVFQYTQKQHKAFIEKPGHFTLLFYKEKELLGYALIAHDPVNRTLELRRIALNQTGLGYGRELMHGIHRWAFEKLEIHRLWLDAFEDNKRAIRLYESMGYIYEGTLRDTVFSEGTYRSQVIYSLLEEEYNALKEIS